MKKLFETHYSLEKNCLQVSKMVTPAIKTNDPSLTNLKSRDLSCQF